jgi:hypothetical protein
VALTDSLTIETLAARKGPRCSVCTAREAMSDEDRDALDSALANKAVPNTVIHRALKREGIVVGEGSVSRHRAKECSGP